jgi:excisionase family DNA binding protein
MVSNSDVPARLLSIIAAAKALGVSRNTVFALLSSGKLGYVRIGRRRLVPADTIENFISANLVAKEGCAAGRVA